MKIIKTTVPCPDCQKPICNLCAFNGVCEDCGSDLPDNVRNDVVQWLQNNE